MNATTSLPKYIIGPAMLLTTICNRSASAPLDPASLQAMFKTAPPPRQAPAPRTVTASTAPSQPTLALMRLAEQLIQNRGIAAAESLAWRQQGQWKLALERAIREEKGRQAKAKGGAK